jgi:hypothetical protein
MHQNRRGRGSRERQVKEARYVKQVAPHGDVVVTKEGRLLEDTNTTFRNSD